MQNSSPFFIISSLPLLLICQYQYMITLFKISVEFSKHKKNCIRGKKIMTSLTVLFIMTNASTCRALSRISKQKNRVRDDVEKNWPAPLNGNSDLAAIQRVTVGSAVNHCQKRKCSLVWPPPPPPLVQHEKCDSRYLDAGEIKLPAMVLEDGGVAAGMFGCIKKSGNCRVCKSLRDDEDDATLEGSVERSLEPTLWPKLRLECAGLNFDRRQLARLNLRFASFISSADDPEAGARNSYQKFQLYSQTDGDTGVERARASVEQATERLLQRLLCTVADLDARFASKFLATLASKTERAEHGYFALAVAPPPNLRCEERRSAWAASFPGMELELDEHFCASSTPRKAVRVLRHLISKMRKEANDDDEFEGLVTVNDYTLRTLMWHQLERWTSVNAWEPASLAAHVLLALDALLANLKSRHASHFVLPDCNILCQTPLHPSLIAKYGDHEEACDAAMLEDTQLVMDCLLRLHQASTSASPLPQGVSWDGEEEVRRAAALEAALLWRWGTALNIVSPLPPAMLPPAVPWFEKIGRFILREEETIAPPPEHFSNRQIDYLAQLMLEYLRFTKSCLAPQAEAEFQNEAAVDVGSLRDSGPGGASEETEDFLFLMHAVVNQALGSSAQTVGKGSKKRRRRRQTRAQPDKQQVWRDVVCDAVRREPLAIGVLKDEIALVRHLLRWMHNATELAPRALKKKLSNFTMQLWATSREAVWHLPEWKKHRQECQDELNAMAAFCTMLLNSQEGWTGVAVLKDAAEKGWIWAKAAQSELVRSGCLQFVLAPAKGVVRRCDVALAIQPSSRDTSPSQISKKISKSCTLPARTSRTPNISQNELTLRLEHRRGSGGHGIPLIPVHQRLRDGSPLSVALDNRRRHGQQCALSSLVHAFIAMHRISVLQDVAALLPPHERQPVLDALQKLSRARRLTRMNSDVGFEEKFTMKNFEFPILDPLGRPFDDSRNENCRKKLVDAANMAINILGTCRNARTLQRRHSLYSPMGNTSLIYSTSPASIRRRHAGAPMQGIALLQLSDGGQLTLNSGSDRDTSQMF
ncbi:uncharacterized protein LOC132197728 isoform X11 [Neocloeon triangulifer]|uniref:uncharacterized protein LOC132197728 isoform X11 n=1 Tax=Neocloeon triangulifer TaxID=2078957 RepID=UPI00286F0856|nr:uncharacterized protein LOC132197728 isoform X11 [Neocloeon triangulifer]